MMKCQTLLVTGPVTGIAGDRMGMQEKVEKVEQKGGQMSLGEVAAELAVRHASYGDAPPITIKEAGAFLERVVGVLFPHYSGIALADTEAVEQALARVRQELLAFLGCATGDTGSKCDEIADAFIARLPEISDAVRLDAEALLEGDPAAASLSEIIMAYPGCYAITAYRIAHCLYESKIPLFPRLISEYAHRVTGIDINPGATIGRSFYVDHGTAIVIGETAIIGDNVKIYQGVTLGALKVGAEYRDKKRHPTVEDNVVIYANATILGGETVIGHDSVVGGNVWLTQSVLPYSRVMYRSSDSSESGLDWDI